MEKTIRTLIAYVYNPNDNIPSFWKNLRAMRKRSGIDTYITDQLGSNQVKVVNMLNLKVDYRQPLVSEIDIKTREYLNWAHQVFMQVIGESPPIDILVADQDGAGHLIVDKVSKFPINRPKLILRFSERYGQRAGMYSEEDYNVLVEKSPFEYDMPRNFHLLYRFLTYRPLQKALRSGVKEEIAMAIERFNISADKQFFGLPIIPIRQ